MGKLSSPEEAPFGNLIAAKDAPFWASLRPSPEALNFYPKFGQPPAAIIWKRGHFGDTWIAHDFPKILGKSWTIPHRLRMPHFKP